MSAWPPPGTLARKWRKLRRDPVRFFADARNPVLRKAGLWWLGTDGEPPGVVNRTAVEPAAIMRRPEAPPQSAWRALVEADEAGARGEPVLDVIVPAYRGYGDTLACIHSVLSAPSATPFELIVIDDAAPEPGLREELRRLADLGLFTLHRNADNRGFAATINRGLALHPERDAVILNSDTLVYGDWLDRLRRHALGAGDVATVTPLSNNATICSYPHFDRDNRSPLELDFASIDAIAARANRGRAVEAPTGVGFCMYIRRECLEQVGPLDEQRFGRGYGEENDFCRRAAEAGWRHLIACDIFIRHTGGVSFGVASAARLESGLKLLNERHPQYDETIQEFIAGDAVAGPRRRIDAARLIHHAGGRSVLHVTHTRGGGIERHIRDTAEADAVEGLSAITLRPVPREAGRVTLNALDPLDLPNLNPLDLAESAEITDLLVDAGVCRIDVHSFADYPLDILEWIPRLAERLGVTYDFTVHDFLPVCPRINLIDGSGIYCGETGEDACRRCLARDGSPFGKPDIAAWRRAYGGFLAGARTLTTPSRDTAARMARYFPDQRFEIRPHAERIAAPRASLAAPYADDQPVRVAVIGAIGPPKGSAVLLDCARDAARRGLPLEFVLIGTADNEAALARCSNVEITGRYREEAVYRLIESRRCQLAFLPSVWPETYCYTLSIALAAGLYPVVFDLGAPAERLRDAATGTGLALSPVPSPGKINDALLCAAGRAARQSGSPAIDYLDGEAADA